MYAHALDAQEEGTGTTAVGPSPGKTTLTSRLAANGNAPAGQSPVPEALRGLVGVPVSRDGYFAVLEGDASFSLLRAPRGQEALVGQRVRAGDPDRVRQQVWTALAAQLQAEHPVPAPGGPGATAYAPTAAAPATAASATATTSDSPTSQGGPAAGLGAIFAWLWPLGCAPPSSTEPPAPPPGAAPVTGRPGGSVSVDDPAAGGAGAPAPAVDPIDDAKRRYRCTDTIARLMVTEPLTLAQRRELRTRVDSMLRQAPDGHGSLADDLLTKEARALRGMMEQPTLDDAQQQWAHEVIPLQPEPTRGDLFVALQARSPYANQRDNDARWGDGSKVEEPGGDMCNLTALAMCLQYLAVPKPTEGLPVPDGVDPASLQYEDALFYLARKLGVSGGNKITLASTWSTLCAHLGATGTNHSGPIGDRAVWERDLRDGHLRAGHAVMLAGFGHVVRLQAVTDDGLVVDDPYGGSTRPEASWPGGKNSATNPTAGDDSLWPWPEDGVVSVGSYFVVARS